MIDFTFTEDVDISQTPLPDGNIWKETLDRRDYMKNIDENKKLEKSFFNVFTIKNKIKVDINVGEEESFFEEEEDLSLKFIVPPAKECEMTNTPPPILDEGFIIYDFYIDLEKTKFPESLTEEEDHELNLKIRDFPRNLVIRTLDNFTWNYNLPIPREDNNIFIGENRIWEEEKSFNLKGVYSIGTIAVEIKEGSETEGMTGIINELENITKQEFIDKFLEEAESYIEEVNGYLEE